MAPQNRSQAAEALLNERWTSQGYERLTPAEQKFIALWWLNGDVMNGGFDQYFFNSSGDMALDALEGLRDIGAAEPERILREALAVFGRDGYPLDRIG